ncbi:MAG: prolyl oligopeptidase family serine peptidase [Flavobacteriaceae bacterium]|nr:prolyl oligopeptidase family serine peptidase [Flavobacteriaceae bacterium]
MKQSITILLVVFTTFVSVAQKKVITHNDYDRWMRIGKTALSENGKVIVYEVEPITPFADGFSEVYNTQTKQNFKLNRAGNSNLDFEENFVFFQQKPSFETDRKERKDKVKKDKKERNSFFVYDVKQHKITDSILRIKDFKIPEKYGNFVAVQKLKELNNTKENPAKGSKKDSTTVKPKKSLKFEEDYLIVKNLKFKSNDTLFLIKNYGFVENEKAMLIAKGIDTLKKKQAFYKYSLEDKKLTLLDYNKIKFGEFGASKDGKKIAFLAAKDSIKKDSLKFDLFYWSNNLLKKVVDTSFQQLKNGYKLSTYKAPYFSDNGKKLFFFTQLIPKKFDNDTTLLKDELAEVSVWSWNDKLIQTEQEFNIKRSREKSYLSVYDVEKERINTLQDKFFDNVITAKDNNSRYILGISSDPYLIESTWDYPSKRDIYIIDVETGQHKLAIEKTSSVPKLSENGENAVYYRHEDQQWYVLHLPTHKIINLTASLKVPFYEVDNDLPTLPEAYGFGGFINNKTVLLYDEFDIWQIDLTGKINPINLTKDGRINKIEYRLVQLSSDRDDVDKVSYFNKNMVLRGFDKKTKESGYYTLNPKTYQKINLIKSNKKLFEDLKKSNQENVLVYTRQSTNEFPNIWTTKDFKNVEKVSNVNKHDDEFLRGTSELVKWTSYDGKQLEGILYKPENFDAAKKYPMITYFYEKSAVRLNNYMTPQPSASTVNIAYFTSNGYLVFVPDIVYEIGYPGKSAYNCIMSGVEAMEKLPFVDSANLGIQGQSWGGYQTAYLITKTNKFKAAMAGAPVSNMISAYGGIRWESGKNRAFQYEKTQSRIGKTPWEDLNLYIENSPLFGVPTIETPVLIMANESDGAVPKEQGIEFYIALRRFQKPSWLLMYKDEAHNLRKQKNRKDLSVRMSQFFDHYLKGEKTPNWMINGIEAVDKGTVFAYDLSDDKNE